MSQGIEGSVVAVYRKPGCPTCDYAVAWVEEAARTRGLSLVIHNVLADEALWRRYRYLVPVVAVGGRAVLSLRFTEAELARALDEAAPSRSP